MNKPKNPKINPPHHHFKEQTTRLSDEDDVEVDDDDDVNDDDDDDSYYDEDGQLPAAMVISTEKPSTQSTITNNGSGATLSIRNAKSVSKKSKKPVINVRAVIKFSSHLF